MLVPGILTIIIMFVGLLLIKTDDPVSGPILFLLLPLLFLVFILIILLGFWFNFALMRVIDALYKKNAVSTLKIALIDARKVVWKGMGTIVAAGFYAIWPIFLSIFGFALYRFAIQIINFNAPILDKVISILFGLFGIYGLFHMLYYSIKLVFGVYAVVIGGGAIKESLKLSKLLTDKRWWGIFGRLIGASVVVYIVIMIINTVLTAVGGLIGGVGDKIATFLSSVVNLLITPYTVAIVVILFNEAKKTQVSTPPQD